MTIVMTVNLPNDEVNYETTVVDVQDAIDDAIAKYPEWTSMVVVFSNPNL